MESSLEIIDMGLKGLEIKHVENIEKLINLQNIFSEFVKIRSLYLDESKIDESKKKELAKISDDHMLVLFENILELHTQIDLFNFILFLLLKNENAWSNTRRGTS